MLILDNYIIGNKLLALRKRKGLTQAQLAEIAGLSDRAYADIERGTVNMRMQTILRICQALHITPDEIFTDNSEPCKLQEEEVLHLLNSCTEQEKETALALLTVYLNSLTSSSK